MKATLKFLTIAMAILFSGQITAQEVGDRVQLVKLRVENTGNIECAHTAKLIVSYSYGGFNYSQISSAVAMDHHVPTTLSVIIPAGSVVTAQKLRIEKGSDVIIHTVAGPSSQSLNSSQWCYPNGVSMQGVFFGYLVGGVLPYTFF